MVKKATTHQDSIPPATGRASRGPNMSELARTTGMMSAMRSLLSNEDGGLIAMVLGVTAMVCLLIISVMTITVGNIQMGQRMRFQTEAFDMAEAGADYCAVKLRDYSLQYGAPTNTSSFQVTGCVGDQTLADGTFNVTIVPGPDNATQYLKTFRLVSTGTVKGITRKVEVVVQQASFGRYAYFTDSETSSITSGAISWKAGEVCDGPAHSNNTGGSNFQINYNGSTASIFKDQVTAHGSSINFSPSTPTNETTWQKIFSNGSHGYLLNVQAIDLPPTTAVQQNAAWGASTGFPATSTGVYLRANNNGGLYLQGDSQITLSMSGANQVIAIKQGSNTTTITVNNQTGAMTSTGPVGTGSPTSTTTRWTGVIYCTGNITSLSGEMADNYVSGGTIQGRSEMTIATDVNNNKDITVTNNLTYHTRPDKTRPSTDSTNLSAGTMGLVARNITVASTAPQNLEIDAVILAGGRNTTAGSFSVSGYDSKTPVGTLKITGGVIQKNRGPVGTFNSGTGVTQTGYSKSYSYDPRMATTPPPYFPTTGTYERLSWKVLPN